MAHTRVHTGVHTMLHTTSTASITSIPSNTRVHTTITDHTWVRTKDHTVVYTRAPPTPHTSLGGVNYSPYYSLYYWSHPSML